MPIDLRAYARSLAAFRSVVVELSGQVRNSADSLTMLYVGNGSNLEFVSGAAFGSGAVVRRIGNCNIWRAGAQAVRHGTNADMVVVDVPWPYDIAMPDDRNIVEIPAWVRQETELAESWDGILANLRKSVRDSQLRKIRKFGLTPFMSRDPKAIDYFYDAMYVPHIQRRFGENAHLESRRDVHKYVASGTLLNIVRDGEVIGACVLLKDSETLRLLIVGFSKSDLREIDGASAGIYFYTLSYAHENGCRKVDFRGSRPLLNDGVLAVKRRWGAGVFDDWSMENLVIQFNDWSPGVRTFLRNCPVITCQGDRLVGKVLLGDDELTPGFLNKLARRFVCPGIDGLNIYSEQGIRDTECRFADPGSARVQLIELAGSKDPLAVYCDQIRENPQL